MRSVRSSSTRIPELDGLRGLAILLVVLYHLVQNQTVAAGERVLSVFMSFSSVGWIGVDLFFVLSGFLIGGILLDAKDSPRYFRTFYLRRIHRIFPLYYLWIGTYFIIVFTPLLRHAAALAVQPAGWTIIPSYGFFAQNFTWSRTYEFRPPWLGTLWSLALEEHFYLAAPFLIRYCSRRRLIQILCFVVGISPFLRAIAHHYFSADHVAVAYILTPCRADGLAMGVLLAVAWRTERWRAWLQSHTGMLWGIVTLLFVGIAALLVTGATQFSLSMTVCGFTLLDVFFSGLLVLVLLAPGGIWGRFCRWRFLISLGGISYCIYVIHTEAIAVFYWLFTSASDEITAGGVIAAILSSLIVMWILAKLSWRVLESPMIRRGHRFTY